MSPSDENRTKIEIDKFFLTKRDPQKPRNITFDPDIYLIEDDILNQISASSMFSSRDPMFIRIFGYFITRKYLTQKTLQRITGLSTGKISEEVNILLKNGLIEKVDVSDKGKITYGVESAGILLLKFSKSIINKMVKWEGKLEEMKLELDKYRQNLENLEGYSRIRNINDFLLKSIYNYKRFISAVDKIIEFVIMSATIRQSPYVTDILNHRL